MSKNNTIGRMQCHHWYTKILHYKICHLESRDPTPSVSQSAEIFYTDIQTIESARIKLEKHHRKVEVSLKAHKREYQIQYESSVRSSAIKMTSMPISPSELQSEATSIRISQQFNKGMSPIRFGDEQAAWMNKARTHKCDTGPVEDPMQGVTLAKEPKKI